MRGETCAAFCAVPAAEGSDRLHIARPKLRTREIKVSENSESNKEICEKRKKRRRLGLPVGAAGLSRSRGSLRLNFFVIMLLKTS